MARGVPAGCRLLSSFFSSMGSAAMSSVVQMGCAPAGLQKFTAQVGSAANVKPYACLTTLASRLAANPTSPPSRCHLPIAMDSPAAASPARRLSIIFSSTKPRTRPPKPAPKPAQARESRNLTKILKVIFRERNPDKLVSRFIAQSTVSERFRDDHRVYDVAVNRLASFGRHDAIAAIIDSQKPFIEASNVGFAARLIRLCGHSSMPSHAAAIFHDLPPKHKSVMTFNALLAAYVEARDFDTLATAFQQILASHPTIVPCVYSYNLLIRALCQKPDFSAALDVIKLMEKRGVTPNIIHFNILLDGFYNNGRFDKAEKIWEMIDERNLQPTAWSYNAKLRGLVAEGRIEDAIAVIERMQKEGPEPDSVSYNVLIRGYCKEGRLNEAQKVYDDLVRNGRGPHKSTFETLILCLLEAGELDLALNYCQEIFSTKCRVKCSSLQAVVTALVSSSRVEEARRIVKLGWKNNYPPCHLNMPALNGKDNCFEAETALNGKGCIERLQASAAAFCADVYSSLILLLQRQPQQGLPNRHRHGCSSVAIK